MLCPTSCISSLIQYNRMASFTCIFHPVLVLPGGGGDLSIDDEVMVGRIDVIVVRHALPNCLSQYILQQAVCARADVLWN